LGGLELTAAAWEELPPWPWEREDVKEKKKIRWKQDPHELLL
jgi:hypothetical protein